MSRLLTLISTLSQPKGSHLRRNRAKQWQRAALRQAQDRQVVKMSLFERLDYNLAAGYMAVGW
jgi:hypothetical protein